MFLENRVIHMRKKEKPNFIKKAEQDQQNGKRIVFGDDYEELDEARVDKLQGH